MHLGGCFTPSPTAIMSGRPRPIARIREEATGTPQPPSGPFAALNLRGAQRNGPLVGTEGVPYRCRRSGRSSAAVIRRPPTRPVFTAAVGRQKPAPFRNRLFSRRHGVKRLARWAGGHRRWNGQSAVGTWRGDHLGRAGQTAGGGRNGPRCRNDLGRPASAEIRRDSRPLVLHHLAEGLTARPKRRPNRIRRSASGLRQIRGGPLLGAIPNAGREHHPPS